MLKPRPVDLGENSSIVLPEAAIKPQMYVEVLSVGDEINGIEVGDVVLVPPQAGLVVLLDEFQCKILMKPEILGVFKNFEIEEDDRQTFIPEVKEEKKILTLNDGQVIPGRP